MKKNLVIVGLALMLTTGYATAESTAKGTKSNTSSAIAGSVNSMEITVAEANEALQVLTKGKMTWETLPEDGKKQLIEMMAPKKLAAVAAEKELTAKEKEAAISGFWMQKKMAETTVSDEEAKKAYDKMKEGAAKNKQKIPEFEAAKNNIKMQLRQGKVVNELMKSAKIKLK